LEEIQERERERDRERKREIFILLKNVEIIYACVGEKK